MERYRLVLLDSESRTLSTTGLFVVDGSRPPDKKVKKITMLPRIRLLGQKIWEKRVADRREMWRLHRERRSGVL
jgi:hypothetical protein